MNCFIGTNKIQNSTAQKRLSFGAKTLEQFKSPAEILKYARNLTDKRERYIKNKFNIKQSINDSKKINKGEKFLSDIFEKGIKGNNKNKNKEHIFDTAKTLLAYYMTEKPSQFLSKAEEVGIKLNKNIGEVGLKLKKELVESFPSINMISRITSKKPARACIDHIVNNTTYKKLNNHLELIKVKKAVENFEFLD